MVLHSGIRSERPTGDLLSPSLDSAQLHDVQLAALPPGGAPQGLTGIGQYGYEEFAFATVG